MRITFLIVAALLTAFHTKAQSETTKNKLIGKWIMDSVSVAEISNNKAKYVSPATGESNNYIEFKGNGEYYSYINQTSNNGSYILLSDNTIQMDDSPIMMIKELTKTKLYLYSKKIISPKVYVENKYFFHR